MQLLNEASEVVVGPQGQAYTVNKAKGVHPVEKDTERVCCWGDTIRGGIVQERDPNSSKRESSLNEK